MTQADTQRITLRYKAIDQEAIERLKALTYQNTANKALLKAAHEYPALVDQVEQLQADNEELRRSLGVFRRSLLNFTQGLEQLLKLADE